MRPIPEDKLEAVVLATYPLKESHGAPVHIGDAGQCTFHLFNTMSVLVTSKGKMIENGGIIHSS